MRAVPAGTAEFVAKFEGFVDHTYLDAVGIKTRGFGHTGPDVQMGQTVTRAHALEDLAIDLEKAVAKTEGCVSASVIAALSDNQYAALISFVFNVGLNPKWDIVRMLAARQFDKVPEQMRLFVNAGGKRLPGLVSRRAAESALWASSIPAKPPVPVIGVGPLVVASAPVAAIVAHASPNLAPWFIAIALVLCFVAAVYLFHLSRRTHRMTVSSDIQPIVDAINADAALIATAIANAGTAGNAALQAQLDTANADLATERQNHTDDVAALQASVDALKAQIPG